MAFPTVEGTTGQISDAANGTTHVASYPTSVSGGIQANDLLLVFMGIDAAATGTVVSNWNGFTQLDWGDVGGTVSASGGCAWTRAVGGETGTITFTTNNAERAGGLMYCVRGAHTTSAPEIGTTTTGNSTNPDPPSLTPTWGAEDTLWFAAVINDLLIMSAAPTNYTDLETIFPTSAAAVSTARRNLNATSDNPGTFTAATEQWRAITLAIRPAAAAPTTTLRLLGATGAGI